MYACVCVLSRAFFRFSDSTFQSGCVCHPYHISMTEKPSPVGSLENETRPVVMKRKQRWRRSQLVTAGVFLSLLPTSLRVYTCSPGPHSTVLIPFCARREIHNM